MLRQFYTIRSAVVGQFVFARGRQENWTCPRYNDADLGSEARNSCAFLFISPSRSPEDTATPAQPVSKTDSTLSGLIPPIAMTGMVAAFFTALNPSTPFGVPTSLVAVGKIEPKPM